LQIKKSHYIERKSSYPNKTGLVTWAMFLVTLVVVLVSLTPTIFPALLLRTFGDVENISGINPFEIGIWTWPFLVTNFALLAIGVLSIKDRLWKPITKAIRFILDFEISNKVAVLVISILIGLYISLSVGELLDDKYHPDFYHLFTPWLENYSPFDTEGTPLFLHVQLFLVDSSMKIFGNYEVIPFIASIALLVLTYVFTRNHQSIS